MILLLDEVSPKSFYLTFGAYSFYISLGVLINRAEK